jgi:Chitin binding Peritrophin-A domain
MALSELLRLLCGLLIVGLTVEAANVPGLTLPIKQSKVISDQRTANGSRVLRSKPTSFLNRQGGAVNFEWDEDSCVGKDDMETLPHPDDCKLFFICWDEILYPDECPPGFLFDWWLGRCTWDDEAVCYPEWPDDVEPDDDRCPPPGSGELVFLPSEFCDEFFICIDGNPVPHLCREGQHWNAQENFCDDPRDAGCDVS